MHKHYVLSLLNYTQTASLSLHVPPIRNELALSACCSCILRLSGKKTAPLVINAVAVLVYLIDRHHPGDDQRDTSVDRAEDAGRHSGTAETGRGRQPTGLSGSHAGSFVSTFQYQSQFKTS